jgi:hypothetical protein
MLRVVSFLKGQRKPNWEEGGERREEKKKAGRGGRERKERKGRNCNTYYCIYYFNYN